MKLRKLLALVLSLAMAMSLAACGGSNGTTTDDTNNQPEASSSAVADASTPDASASTPDASEDVASIAPTSQVAVVEGCDWGPAVTKTIVPLEQAVTPESVTVDSFTVVETKESFNWASVAEGSTEDPTVHITATADRTVTAAYTCDADGNQVDTASNYVALEMSYDPNNGSPFCYDLLTSKNTWCTPYELAVSLAEGQTLTAEDGSEVSELNVDPAIDWANAQMPDLEGIDLTGTFTGSDGKTLCYASYAPADASESNKKPLVIWLQGAGEGGEDPTILLLGNKVSALVGDEFQSAMGGAYVLTPQTPEFWLCYDEEGNWSDNPGVDSIYLNTLKELIDNYVAENPGVDADRIIIGGCSNGGYMTMDMILNYPDYFAAAYPICEAYADAGITDEQLEGIKDLPIWFVYAENDTTVLPETYEAPTIERLKALGASNLHTSIFEDVHDTTGLYTDENGDAYQYMGHWSWLYFFNNECVDENGVNLWSWMAEQSK
jgi:predicted peptidase